MNNSILTPFDLDDYIKSESENINIARTYFKRECEYFDELTVYFAYLLQEFGKENKYSMAQLSLFNNCYRCSVTGFTNVLRANIRFSYYYLRLISESVQYSIYIKEKPQEGELWTSYRKEDTNKFQKKYKKWFKENRLNVIKNNFPTLAKAYKDSSYLIHANFESMELQHKFTSHIDGTTYRLNFHDVSPDKKGTLSMYSCLINHLLTYQECLQWWLSKDLGLVLDRKIGDNFNKLSKSIKYYSIEVSKFCQQNRPE